jgi:hypothetical protein
LYGKLGKRYVSDNNISYSIRVDGDKIRPVTSKGGIEEKTEQLHQ